MNTSSNTYRKVHFAVMTIEASAKNFLLKRFHFFVKMRGKNAFYISK
jgi:hypothetical protein